MNMEDSQDIQVNGFIKFLVEDRYRVIRHVIFNIGLFLLFYSNNPKLTSDSSQIYKFYMVLIGWSVLLPCFMSICIFWCLISSSDQVSAVSASAYYSGCCQLIFYKFYYI